MEWKSLKYFENSNATGKYLEILIESNKGCSRQNHYDIKFA